jgi:Lrp/AsnC family leucine-responsive transcriptional regulator
VPPRRAPTVTWIASTGGSWRGCSSTDPGKLGLGLLAYVEVSLDRTTPDAFDRFKQVALAHDEVMECHMVAGGFDYLLKIRVTDMESYRRFLGDRLAAVRGVQQTHTYFVMEEVKSTQKIAVPE